MLRVQQRCQLTGLLCFCAVALIVAGLYVVHVRSGGKPTKTPTTEAELAAQNDDLKRRLNKLRAATAARA
jgi:hypothetical protein